MAALEKKALKYGNAKKIIGVVSGKGGVGKSVLVQKCFLCNLRLD